MAQKRIVELIDDLSGKPAKDGRTVFFSLDGVDYEIDLSAKNAQQLTEVLALYAGKGRRSSLRGRRARTTKTARAVVATDKQRLQEIRAWAQQNGYQLASRGRIKTEVVEAFDRARG